MESKVKQIKRTAIIVKLLLEKTPHLRDSDDKLVATIWYNQLGIHELQRINGYDILKLISDGALIDSQSICRARRKIQEEHIELQGKNYKKRKSLQVEVRKEIHSI